MNGATLRKFMSQSSNKIDFHLLSRVLTLAKPYRLIFTVAAILAVIMAPVATLRPYLVQVMVDDYIFQGDIPGLTFMAFVFVGVTIFGALLRWAFLYSTNWLGQSVIRDLRVRVFKHISSLRLTYFDKTPIGTSTTRTINDIETINTIFTQGVITIIADLLTVIAVLGIMFITSWQLTLVVLTTMPFLLVATYIFKEKVKAAYQTVRTQIQKMNAFLQERITGMRIVQIFNAEKAQMEDFKKINRAYAKANLDSILYYAIFFPVVEIIHAAALGLMVWWGAQNVVRDYVTLGALVAFPLYVSMLFRPMRMLADKFNTLQMGLVAADRVFGILDRKDKIPNNGTFKPQKLEGNIAFKNVSFAYNARDYVLKNISFDIQAGETLAIVGSTGSGKSTIINILNRFYEIQKGSIEIDGTDISDFELQALRARIAMVLQDVFLFSGSVLENITLRDKGISKEKVIEAAKMIGAHKFINKLPGGYDYQVMERGATLSMGQRQLISFVRALVFNPDILILDEATSSIDPETESVIQYAIEQLIAKRTSIIIAHRLSTIRHANNILVLSKGEIQEYGSHEELLTLENGHYKELYEMQFLQMADVE
ncbi:ABC transporter ATP-binding protein/permease [Saprospiraceae bacterium]|jgi:ATP-binding cassette subfamily B multidrug efflux pump|nr:ABC transporter ATP-binding protein/permease [Saprospiraceae bacterium]MDF1867888.1 ABC transporter ATP-binding protein [Saprospiraceae bacterium]